MLRPSPPLAPHERSLAAYVRHRLGDEQRMLPLLRENFVRAFTAETFAGFWRAWNPVYGYVLRRWVYRPLARLFPKGASVVLTFAFSGFAFHDVLAWPAAVLRSGRVRLPATTTWFVLVALVVLLSESSALRRRLHLGALPPSARVVAHAALLAVTHVAGSWLATFVLLRFR